MVPLSDAPRRGLVVTRSIGQEVVIEQAGQIVAVVQLSSVGGGRAGLRIRARPDVLVDRAEVYHRRRKEPAGGPR